MESSPADAIVSEKQIEPSDAFSPTAKKNSAPSTKKASKSVSKKPSENPKRSLAKQTRDRASKKLSKSKKNRKYKKPGKPRGFRNDEDFSSSDTEVDSHSNTADGSSTESSSNSTISTSDDEEHDHGRHNSRQNRDTSRGANTGEDQDKLGRRTDSAMLSGQVMDLLRASCNDVAVQRDLGEAFAQLEMRCKRLQFQLDNINGFQTAPNMAFESQLQSRMGTYRNMFAPAELTQNGFPNSNQATYVLPNSVFPTYKPPDQLHMRDYAPHSGGLVNATGSQINASSNADPLQSSGKVSRKKGMNYKRIDSVWDRKLYRFKIQDTARVTTDSKYDEYLFHVRRTFDTDGKYKATFVDIKSKLLQECLQDVVGNVGGVNLVDETPKLDPNLLFLYLEDFQSHLKKLKEVEPAGKRDRERRKNQLRLDNKRQQLKVLIKYLDKDYAKVKESLYPMLDSGIITFDCLWALWKPNTLVYSTTYGSAEDPRLFKVNMAVQHTSVLKGTSYIVDGKYLEFDGKQFGHGFVVEEIPEFQGTRKINSLPFYPLEYHSGESKLRQMLIERGKKFVSLNRAHYKAYSGVAYMKGKKGSVTKFHLQPSRIMIDPAIFRRINPNYFVSPVQPQDFDALSESGMSDDEYDAKYCFSSDNFHDGVDIVTVDKLKNRSDFGSFIMQARHAEMGARSKTTQPPKLRPLPTTSDTESCDEEASETPRKESSRRQPPEFTDDDYLVASSVVLGFAFSEKLWLEFSVSRIHEIKWNEDAWNSLVLPLETKDLLQALVKSRKHNVTKTTDDFIQGKGKGLVTVLHGPPGTGKTLTAEGISESFRCPLYMASAGELGTDPRLLEADLQKILEVCHAWGAILLLDEADVFLEKRNIQDIHRNALVSIFLRQLEYFQGIMFLTTNRVETFDEAFQSRIHIALRYEGLDAKAKKTIFKLFIDRVKAHGKLTVDTFTDDDLNKLAKHELNGREIKNVIGSAQDLALNKSDSLAMRHVQQVLDIHVKFGRDLRGGTGYEDAMRNYC
ncbi:hypothetical protein QQS21_007684 [Conoideocrella luteorostrata]|uniref:AAA+ ATPase domain-containing protein n=1 Tax=Conoideocrella luteorostrata TaxID=1105319 RepID=A0AAJ0FWR3_9HYPO|nr:hypothetical protein QQS21_007684 [Conoideocrella luteorostrata]